MLDRDEERLSIRRPRRRVIHHRVRSQLLAVHAARNRVGRTGDVDNGNFCLAVEVGPATSPSFFWTGGNPPDIGSDAWAIAVSANGVDCLGGDPNGAKRRPSISAVDTENDDVLVEIEDLPEGRPLASGAIIPRPGPKGAVYVRPQNARVIYAKGAFAGRCKVR